MMPEGLAQGDRAAVYCLTLAPEKEEARMPDEADPDPLPLRAHIPGNC